MAAVAIVGRWKRLGVGVIKLLNSNKPTIFSTGPNRSKTKDLISNKIVKWPCSQGNQQNGVAPRMAVSRWSKVVAMTRWPLLRWTLVRCHK